MHRYVQHIQYDTTICMSYCSVYIHMHTYMSLYVPVCMYVYNVLVTGPVTGKHTFILISANV